MEKGEKFSSCISVFVRSFIYLFIYFHQNLLDASPINNEKMLDGGLMSYLESIEGKAWGDDDMDDDVKTLTESLRKNIVFLR
jgi:hypothetical protein